MTLQPMSAHSPLVSLSRIEEVRRETADAEQRAAQLEAELQRLTRAQKEREDDLERKMDALNRLPPVPHAHDSLRRGPLQGIHRLISDKGFRAKGAKGEPRAQDGRPEQALCLEILLTFQCLQLPSGGLAGMCSVVASVVSTIHCACCSLRNSAETMSCFICPFQHVVHLHGEVSIGPVLSCLSRVSPTRQLHAAER